MGHRADTVHTEDTRPSSDSSSASFPDLYEEAMSVSGPYARTEKVALCYDELQQEFDIADVSSANLTYGIRAERLRHTEVQVKASLWDEAGDGCRYSLYYERPSSAEICCPFDTYQYHIRYQDGTIDGSHQDDISFTPQEEPYNCEKEVQWNEIPAVDQVRIIEAELVRNPGFTRHRLMTLGAWQKIADVLRYKTDVFQQS